MSKNQTMEIEVASIVPTDIQPKSLKQQMVEEAKKRELITKYISAHMKDKVDYGKIHVNKNCSNPYTCNNDFHYSKPSLFKPGAEKFASLFKLRAAWRKDSETWEMLGSLPGTICYVCELFTSKNDLVGEGRGASSVEEKKHPNIAIKIAKKRAFVDAILATGALSDFFTQDLEDLGNFDKSPVKDNAKVITYGAEEEIPTDETEQKKIIITFVKQLDKKLDWKDAKTLEGFISDQTQLALVPKNFPAIIRALENTIQFNQM